MNLIHKLLASALLASTASSASAADWGSFDASRINYANGVFTTSPYFSDLRAKVVAAGGSIAPVTGVLTPAYLSTVDVFFTSALGQTSGTLAKEEQEALVAWVKCGGTLFVTAEHQTITANDSFLAPFGITTQNFGTTGVAAPTATPHPLTNGVSLIQYAGQATLSTGPDATDLMIFGLGNLFAAVIEAQPSVGLGRVLAIGDHTPLADASPYDEAQLRTNIAQWAETAPPPPCPNDTATWSNYGAGWPGTHGVPQMTLLGDPVIGEQVTLLLENSLQKKTTALVIFAAKTANLPSDLGGTLLVVPKVEATFTLPAGGLKLTELLPCDTTLCGANLFMQTLMVDPGASHGLSFTPGLTMTFGS